MRFFQVGGLTALFALITAIAAAQTPIRCTASTEGRAFSRVEGMAEEISQVLISCKGGTATAAGASIPTINVQIVLNTNVTSRLLDSTGNRSEALLLIDDPIGVEQVEASAVPFTGTVTATGTGIYKTFGLAGRPTVFGGQQTAPNTLTWSNIPFDPPGDGWSRTFRLVNIRANANQLGLGSDQNPSEIMADVSISSVASLALEPTRLTVSTIRQGMTFWVTTGTYNQCEPGTKTFTLNYRPAFGIPFRRKRSTLGSQNGVGSDFNTESMFYNLAFTGIGAGAGLSSQGTRLVTRFTNVPANVTLTVPISGGNGAGDAASLVPPGTDGSTANTTTGVVTLTGGAGTAVYEVTWSAPVGAAVFSLDVKASYGSSPMPGLGAAQVAGNFAPLAGTDGAFTAAVPRFVDSPLAATAFAVVPCEGDATVSVNRPSLSFAMTTSGTARTPPQEALVLIKGGTGVWTAASDSSWLQVNPLDRQGSGKLVVSISPYVQEAPAGNFTGKVTVRAVGAGNGPQVVNCTLSIKDATTGPFGSFDTPVDKITGVAGSIAVTGWALDDIGVKKVTIWRDPVGPEAVHANGYVYIGDSLFVPGSRPDVEAKYPTTPNAYRAGWGYMLLTNPLPGKGNGTFKLHAIAEDEEGKQFKLGTKTITVDNLRATKPFGALDSPAPGQIISGTFSNDGWALTPPTASIPTDGSTIWVSVDGVYLGHPLFGGNRGDVASIFPGYANTNSSAGQYALDSTKHSNAMHTIAWIVYDNQGRGDGIGSRFFTTQNSVTAGSAEPVLAAERTLQLRMNRVERRAATAASYPAFRRGYDLDATLTPIRQAGEGLLEPVAIAELDRVEIQLPGGQKWTAALRFGDELRELPIGSTFDAEGGIFYWQLGPGFLGEYVLEFRAEDGTVVPVAVQVGGANRSM